MNNTMDQQEKYILAFSSQEDPLLTDLSRHTYLREVHPQMLSGHILGSFLRMFSRLLSPERILEIGTFTGYSAICLARGLRPGGRLFTIEVNDELRKTTLEYIREAGLQDSIELINGDALQVIPQLNDIFDLVFIDANKEHYPDYYSLVFDKVRSGGYILVDNVLWGGKVLDDSASDITTRTIQDFNALVTTDQRVENYILPIRDGIMVINKL
jgi:predicted O-methyltransferase YrrM